ncbi:hypothetical protein KSP35_09230 [Aquihabitans sp. G128]|uniref:hypothetical protein n=1 Tax=Aquihabitans sp. G128 TaxID=2849779 RepID=UPI001C2350D2|nr:hypothetical protein [Aquihabitans sp. G128]QXC62940.1 hypothetical protein KSP35_09230 [Aquihabitans sp. G128]
MKQRIAIVAVALACTLAACSGSSDKASSDGGSAGGGGATTTSASKGGSSGGSGSGASGCGEYSPGKDGVLQTFCGGSASVTFESAGTSQTIEGGTCEVSGGFFTLNAGVITGPDFSGAKPDYAGILLPEDDGAFAAEAGDAVASYAIGGTSESLTELSGTHDASGGSFSGKAIGGGEVKATFSC